VDAAKFIINRWEERGYATEFANFIVGEEGIKWLAKPSLHFIISQPGSFTKG
jgi:iron complex outermembrane receptor protein